MNKHKIPSAVIQSSIIMKLLINENIKLIEIWYRLDVQFRNEIRLRSQVHVDCPKLFKNWVWGR